MKFEIQGESEQPSLEHSLEREAWAQAGGLALANGTAEEPLIAGRDRGLIAGCKPFFFFKEKFNLLFCHH